VSQQEGGVSILLSDGLPHQSQAGSLRHLNHNLHSLLQNSIVSAGMILIEPREGIVILPDAEGN
jgi:hypothetical protein